MPRLRCCSTAPTVCTRPPNSDRHRVPQVPPYISHGPHHSCQPCQRKAANFVCMLEGACFLWALLSLWHSIAASIPKLYSILPPVLPNSFKAPYTQQPPYAGCRDSKASTAHSQPIDHRSPAKAKSSVLHNQQQRTKRAIIELPYPNYRATGDILDWHGTNGHILRTKLREYIGSTSFDEDWS